MGRDHFQSPSPANTPSLGRGPFFEGRLFRGHHLGFEPIPSGRQDSQPMYFGYVENGRKCTYGQPFQAEKDKRMVAFVHQTRQ